ncbi:cytochrome c [Phaeobacter sp. B1627]|uniref:c-type cytochrome n=1 Tax=Phaeobacter sp. B1627 TaxID=2583809 RepID=UPI001119F293|nr:cytochrome c [Phaeobacter sp. B1627]TNJ41391.1 cytochrome c [Phaeobacter sp. B1627]
MTHPTPAFALILGVVLALVIGAPATTGTPHIADKYIQKRMALMNSQRVALTALTDMSAGRIPMDSRSARQTRRFLIATTASIPKRFRKRRFDPNSHARPDIWTNWKDFELRAKRAEAAAKGLKTRSLDSLRRTLPDLIQACHSCHGSYRAHVNEFTTH